MYGIRTTWCNEDAFSMRHCFFLFVKWKHRQIKLGIEGKLVHINISWFVDIYLWHFPIVIMNALETYQVTTKGNLVWVYFLCFLSRVIKPKYFLTSFLMMTALQSNTHGISLGSPWDGSSSGIVTTAIFFSIDSRHRIQISKVFPTIIDILCLRFILSKRKKTYLWLRGRE